MSTGFRGPGTWRTWATRRYFYGGGIIVIEWAEKIRDILPAKTLFVSMRYIDENTREMILEGPGKDQKLEEF